MGSEDQAKDAFVIIRYDAEGNPMAEPAELRVKQGARITWQNASGHDPLFVLDFARHVPQPGPPHRRLEAHKKDGRYRASIIATPGPAASAAAQAGSAEERFSYEVQSGDKGVDPVIIIEK
ncbi:hypothetical protein [Aerolutibacter ruishenii]|uniref:Uncharacterized protein n=1 Tax=Aerolutibacter ruishenii TaxID=686800 RepID=A0A562LSL3_9GAMM|nr:hypothetical protein [Lysobacter ruishenii]TWI10592.1 hypothetical protein IP93_01682 [Lysobacter ruishenii]